MSKEKSTDELITHKQEAIAALDSFLDELIASGSKDLAGKADKLSYWINDWTTYLKYEPEFSPLKLRRYKRGEIIKVHLGFNIGSEEGGLHYAVVLDKHNAKSSPVITVVPLTSIKPKTDIHKLKPGNVFLGNELFTNLNSKVSASTKHLHSELNLLLQFIRDTSDQEAPAKIAEFNARVAKIHDAITLHKRIKDEIQKMKVGSIALVSQITTISKMRIFDPKTDHDILSGIKLSNEKLDLIDAEIKKMFTNFQNEDVDK